MDYIELLINIQRKYNYDDEMMKLIISAFVALTTYYEKYGYDSKNIYQMFMNTRIIPYENNINAIGKGIIPTEEKEYLMGIYSDKDEEEIRNNTVYEGGELLYKTKDKKIVIGNKIEKTIIVKKENGIILLETLIHELIHSLVTNEKIVRDDNKPCIKSGLSKDYFVYEKNMNNYYVEGGQIDDYLKYTANHCIEEGLTEYDTVKVCSLIGLDIEPTESYRPYYEYAEVLMEDKYINKIINKTRLTGINYIEKIPNKKLKENVISYINNCENIFNNTREPERSKLISLNKEMVQNNFNKI